MATLLISSSAGIVSLLEEQDAQLKYFALLKLNNIVDDFWAEIAEDVTKLEVLQEDSTFKHRDLAALVVSKVYYNLGAYEVALNYALEAGKLFNVNDTSEYVTTMISKCLDFYIKQRLAQYEAKEAASVPPLDPRIVKLVDDMFQRCLDDGKYKQAIGIAIEARRLDIIKKALIESESVRELLHYTFNISLLHAQNLAFLKLILRELINIYMGQAVPDYINVCQCLIYLDDPQALANILMKLLKSKNKKDNLMAYQMCFDAYECATQGYLRRVRKAMGLIPSDKEHGSNTDMPITFKKEGSSEQMETEVSESSPNPDQPLINGESQHGLLDRNQTQESAKPKMDEDGTEDGIKSPIICNKDSCVRAPSTGPGPCVSKDKEQQYEKVDAILCGDVPIQLDLQFLIQNNRTDPQILKNSKDAVRNSICHNAVIIAHGFVNCGTTSDRFLRNNLEWLAKATNWAKFTATASLGVIHKGHVQEAMNIMSTYLPKENSSGSPYSEGGSLYALGLIHANHGTSVVDYLIQQLANTNSELVEYLEAGLKSLMPTGLKVPEPEIIKHGACLGLGLATMGTARQDVYEILKSNLYQDDAVIGEAAGLAMGLVMLGTNSATAIDDMISYGKETRHEKILRGLILGISFVMFGLMEQADFVIQSLQRDKDPLMRRACVYTLAMAYCGTGNNGAIRKLLHIAVSDVNDDVRRSAVTCLGFLLFQTPEQCPNIVSLLAESYNPHVRYGAALALGIACAGTGLKDAINLLEPLMEDNTNYVRQGALIASAMILIQHNEHTQPKSTAFREKYAKIIGDKHEEIMAKFGALLAQGIIDAGGRNTTISYQSGNGSHVDALSVVGTLVFSQFWFWYPFSHFLSLSFKSTNLVGLNYDLKMPKLDFVSNAKPSTYAYPPMLEAPKNKEKSRMATVVLSYAKGKHHHHHAPPTGSSSKSDKQRRKGSLDNTLVTVGADKEAKTTTPKVVDGDQQMEVVPAPAAGSDAIEIDQVKGSSSTAKDDTAVAASKRGKTAESPMDTSSKSSDEAIKSPLLSNESKKKKLSTSPMSGGSSRPITAITSFSVSKKKGQPVVRDKVVASETIEEVKGVIEGEVDVINSGSSSLTASRAEDSLSLSAISPSLPEASFTILHNPARVVPEQLKLITMQEDSRYIPLKPVTQGGIILLHDTNDQTPEEFVTLISTSSAKVEEDEGEEPTPPEPFQYIEE